MEIPARFGTIEKYLIISLNPSAGSELDVGNDGTAIVDGASSLRNYFLITEPFAEFA